MSPSPFVYWGQNSSTIFLRIALRDVKVENLGLASSNRSKEQPDVSLSPTEVSFKATGIGAHGESCYEFKINPFDSIVPEKSRLKITGSDVLLEMNKSNPSSKEEPWPRLLKQSVKYAWIKPDFDKMDISEDEDEDIAMKKQMEQDYVDKLTADLEKTQKEALDDIKRNYIFSYNLFQFIAYSFIAIRIIYGLISTEDYIAYSDVGLVMVISQTFSFMEVIHPLIGLVKTDVVTPLMQTYGRNFVMLVLIWNEPRLHDLWCTTYLFLFWSLAEIIRYPFYMVSSMKFEIKILTWLRYTTWIILYPTGAACELAVIWNSVNLFAESEKFSMFLPNTMNFSFYMPSYLYCHMIMLLSGVSFLMLHMASQRRKKLGYKNKVRYSQAKKSN